jgi:hypothetical protein
LGVLKPGVALQPIEGFHLESRMDCVLTDLFKDTCEHEFQISRQQVYRAVRDPDSSQIEKFDGLELGFFVKKDDQEDEAPYLLVCARKQNHQWLVDLCFRLRSQWVEADNEHLTNPLSLLQRFAERFGAKLQVGSYQAKFIFRKTIMLGTLSGNEVEVINVMGSVGQGLLYPIVRLEEHQLVCAIAFCIDTGRYTSWLFDWDAHPSQPVRPFLENCVGVETDLVLTDQEKASAHDVAERMFPDDGDAQTEVTKYVGAFTLLKKIFGEVWYQENIVPNKVGEYSFLRRPLVEPLERYLHVILVIELAEALHKLRAVPGIVERIQDTAGHTLEGLWFEFFVPYLIQDAGHRIVEFVPEDPEEKRPDLIVEFRDELIPIEVKAKGEKTEYSRQSLLSLPKKGFEQLPDSGPGVIFLMIHSHWLQDSEFLRQAEPAIERALRRNRNCNAIFVLWPVSDQISHEAFAYRWRFQHFVTRHPMYPVPRIVDLLEKKTFRIKPVQATFV